MKSQLTGKNLDAGKDGGKEEKRTVRRSTLTEITHPARHHSNHLSEL